jgi:hypothetical protein
LDPVNCPLFSEMQHITRTSADLVKSFRRLRRKLKLCNDCENGENCPVLAEFNSEVQSVVQAITEEWNLEAIIPQAHHD